MDGNKPKEAFARRKLRAQGERGFRIVDLRRFIANPMTQRSTTSMAGMERFRYLSEKYAEKSVTMREKRR